MRPSPTRLALAVTVALASCTPAPPPAALPPAQMLRLNPLETCEGLEGSGLVELSRERVEGRRAVKWSVGAGKSHSLRFGFSGRGIEAKEWSELRFRYKVLTEGWTWFGVKLVDHPLADGMQATWRIDGGKGLEPGGWREAVINLTQPMYRWGNKPDTKAQWFCFRAMADKPADILLDDVRLARATLDVRLVETTSTRAPDATRRYQWLFELTSHAEATRQVRVALDGSRLRAFQPTVSPEGLTLAPRQSSRVTIALEEMRGAASGIEPLTTEHATVRFIAEAAPDAIVYPVEICAVTGLPAHNHPVLLVTKAEIAAVKRKVARHDWARKSYDKLIAGADGWLKKAIKLPDRGGQWWHWYSCPKCGTRLSTRGPTKHVCKTCKKVYSGEPYDSVVLSRDHARLARAAELLGLAFQFTGERRYAAKAAEILERYAERYLTYKRHTTRGHDRIGGGRVGPQTLDESTWLIPMVHGYDLIWEALSDEQRAKIEGKLLRPAAELIMEHKIGIHNIQCWKNSAVGLVGICLDEPRFLADAVTSSRGIHKQLAKGILDDGAWFEGAWGYHYYTMSALVPLAEALRHVGIDVFGDRYRSFYAAPLLFALPNGRLPAVNDSGEANAYGPWYRYELAYARWHDPMFAALLKGRPRVSRESLLYGVPELAEAAELPTGSRNFPVGGYAYLQCDEGHNAPVAILDYAPHGGGHGHPEKLQLLFYANGEIVAPDPGCIHYGVPLQGEWYKQTISHNTVVVDQKSQKPCQGKLRFFHATPELAVASATADDAYDGVRFARTVAMLPGGMAVDLVELASDKPHTYDWAFHCYGDFATPLALDKTSEPPGKRNGYQHIRNVRGCSTDKLIAARWAGDKTSVGLTMHARRDTRVYAGDGHGRPPSRKLPTLIVRRGGKTAVFAAAFHIGNKDTQPPTLAIAPAPEGKTRLVVTAGDETAAVLVPLALGKALKPSGEALPPQLAFDTDAQAAMVRLKAGKLKALAFGGGKRLGAGDIAISTSRKAALSLSCEPDGKSVLVIDVGGETELRLAGLFAEGCEVAADDGKRVPATWRRGTLRFTASSGRYTIRPEGK